MKMGSIENETKKEDGFETIIASSGKKSKFLILGGCGFIGRHLVTYLLDKADKIFIIDKTPPELVWLNAEQTESFGDARVYFRSANLITQVGCEKAFENVDSDVEYVINLASETRKGQSEPVYREGIYKLSLNVIQYVSKFLPNVQTYIEFSTGTVYPDGKTPHKECEKVDLWNFESRFKHAVEQEVGKTLENYVIIRPAIVYGPGDRHGITPRLVVGGIYKHLKEMMKLPWNSEIKTHTVHVTDLVRATYFLCKHGKHGEIYNIVDSGDTTQGDLTSIVSEIFNLNHDYWGTAFSTLAKLDMSEVVDEVNDKHMGPWATLCAEDNVGNTPLTPYVHKDALVKKQLSMSGLKLRELGFVDFQHPAVTKELLMAMLTEFVELHMFPKSLLQD